MTVLQIRGGGDVLAGRYTLAEPAHGGLQLVVAHDEVLDRDVSVLLLPGSSSVGDRLALRLQLRQLSSLEHPHLAHAFDVVDVPGQLGVVLRLLPGAVLLSSLGPDLASSRVGEPVRQALGALHAAGRAHGSISADAVAVLPDGSGVLLPLPARLGARPEDDLRALARAFPAPFPPSVVEAPTTVLSVVYAPTLAQTAAALVPAPSTASGAARPATALTIGSASNRAALIAAGGFGGALLADIVSRLLG